MQWQTMSAQDKIDVIVPMLERGYAYSEIAREIPGSTKNAIIGFCYRQGITHRAVGKGRDFRANPAPIFAPIDDVQEMLKRASRTGLSMRAISKASGMSYGALRAISAAGRSLASSLNRINHTLDGIESGSIVITSKRRRMRNMASGHDAISLCDEIYSLPVTIERFCVISGISRPTVSGWMRGRRPKPFMMEVATDAINQIKAGRR